MCQVVDMNAISKSINVRVSFRLLVCIEIINTFKYHSIFKRKQVDGALASVYGPRQITRALTALVKANSIRKLSVGEYVVVRNDNQ